MASSADETVNLDEDALLFTMRSPRGSVMLTQKDHFAIAYSRKLMRSWVNQPSPCCAAASVAGALNALTLKDQDWTCTDLLEYYKAMTNERIRRQKRLVQLAGGIAEQDLDELEAAIRKELARRPGYEFGGTEKLTKKILLGTASFCLQKSAIQSAQSLHDELTRNDMAPTQNVIKHEVDGGSSAEARKDHASVPFEIDLAFDQGSPQVYSEKFQDALYQYLHLIDGLAKLERPRNPSTAICGNEAIVRAVDAINSNEEDKSRLGITGNLRSTLFMGKRSSGGGNVTREVAAQDSGEQRADSWYALWHEFSRDKCVLIYHLKNHYALIFAIREWREPSLLASDPPVQRREVLTARKGQRPSTWVAWEEVYTMLCSWHGYKIISIIDE